MSSRPRPPLSVVPSDVKLADELDPLAFTEGSVPIADMDGDYGFSTRTTYRLLEDPENGLITAKVRGRRVVCRRSIRIYLQRQVDNKGPRRWLEKATT